MEPIELAPASDTLSQYRVVIAIALPIIVACALGAKRYAGSGWKGTAFRRTLLVAVIAFLATSAHFYARVGEEYESRVANALDQQFSYTSIQVDGSSFTAFDGEVYVKGQILRLEDGTHAKVLDSD